MSIRSSFRPVWILAVALGFFSQSAPSHGQILVQHLADTDPLTEGFTFEAFGNQPGLSAVNDGGTPAWQILDDNSPSAEGGRYKYQSLSLAQEASLLQNGFFARAKFRMASVFSNSNPPTDYNVELNVTLNTQRRFVLQWNLSADGDPIVFGSGDGSPVVEVNGAGSGYHDWIYDYTGTLNGGIGKLFMDGQFVFQWTGFADSFGPEYQFEGPRTSGTVNWTVGQLGSGNQVLPEPNGLALAVGAGLVLLRSRRMRG